MYLADRRGSERIPIEGGEHGLDRLAELSADDGLHLPPRKWSAWFGAQLEQLVAVPRRENVEAQRQRLPKLDEGSAKHLDAQRNRTSPGTALRRAGINAPNPYRAATTRTYSSRRSVCTGHMLTASLVRCQQRLPISPVIVPESVSQEQIRLHEG